MYKLRTFTCAGCGEPVERRAAAGAEVRCPPCAVELSAENARQLHAHEGPMYERWVWANALAARRIAGTADRPRRRRVVA